MICSNTQTTILCHIFLFDRSSMSTRSQLKLKKQEMMEIISLENIDELNLKESAQEGKYRHSKKRHDQNHRYHWSVHEQKKYVNFLITKKALFDLSINDRRTKGVHTKMSKLIRSRTSTQCRSHHQKMLAKFGSLENIIKENQSLLTPKNKQMADSSPLPQANSSKPEQDPTEAVRLSMFPEQREVHQTINFDDFDGMIEELWNSNKPVQQEERKPESNTMDPAISHLLNLSYSPNKFKSVLNNFEEDSFQLMGVQSSLYEEAYRQ